MANINELYANLMEEKAKYRSLVAVLTQIGADDANRERMRETCVKVIDQLSLVQRLEAADYETKQ